MPKKLFDTLLENYMSFSQERHGIIKDSSDVLRSSKQAIFSLHRGDITEAEKLIEEAEKLIEKIKENSGSISGGKYLAYHEGSFKAAIEEYVEAKYFYNYLKGEGIKELDNVSTDFYEAYLGGITDVTGELVRRAVLLASAGEYGEVEKIREYIELISGQLLRFNLTGKLRSKYDDAKRNLKRIEGIVYDISMRK